MELLASVGMAAKERSVQMSEAEGSLWDPCSAECLPVDTETFQEMFEYNRAMYSFDQTQRLERELLRLEMQIKRFELFREDIRDLVELTVGKMEMYHLVGALFLEFCATMYVEARIQKNKAPPFLLSLYWLSVAGAWIYLMLAVILSLYASIRGSKSGIRINVPRAPAPPLARSALQGSRGPPSAVESVCWCRCSFLPPISAHAFGVRLLTRFVRLPIPGARQMDSLNAKFSDLERQGLGNVMRVPFVQGAQQWKQRVAEGPAVEDPGAPSAGPGSPVPSAQQALVSSRGALTSPVRGVGMRILSPQNKWQRYDAYARVCMSLGAGQTLMSLSYWMISVCFIHYENWSPITCVALCLIFQLTAMAILKLDVGKVDFGALCLIQSAGFASVSLAVYILWTARRLPYVITASGEQEFQSSDAAHNMGDLDHTQLHREGPICMFLMAVWLQALLFTASPQGESGLPRRFRTVLFLDVFASADVISGHASRRSRFHFGRGGSNADTLGTGLCSTTMESAGMLERVMHADEALKKAEAALRRWREVPNQDTPEARVIEARIERLWTTCMAARRALFQEASAMAKATGDSEIVAGAKNLKPDMRAWHDLSAAEQRDSAYAFALLGPFEHHVSRQRYFYDLENEEFTWQNSEGRGELPLSEAAALTSEAERAVQAAVKGHRQGAAEQEAEEQEEEEEPPDESGGEARGSRRRGGTRPPASGVRSVIAEAAKRRGSLPWKALRSTTLALQFAWVLTGVMLGLENEGVWKPTYRLSFHAERPHLHDEATPHSSATDGHSESGEEPAPEPTEPQADGAGSAAEGSGEPPSRRLSAPRARARRVSERWHARAVDATWPAGASASWPEAVASLQ
ncbi:unnamed protein product, partial [Prorocentrum cordatum]